MRTMTPPSDPSPNRQTQARLALRLSLAVLWLLTAWVSLHAGAARGQALLLEAGLPPAWQLPLIWAGSLWDVALGLGLLCTDRRAVLMMAGAGMVAMTVLATVWLPGLWLDPLGCLSKNLPIAAALWWLDASRPSASPTATQADPANPLPLSGRATRRPLA
jgi:hypothetical protein